MSGYLRPTARRKLAARITPFALEEFIGETVRVKESSSKGAKGIEGTVLDETANTLVLDTNRGRKTIPKKGTVFYFPAVGQSVPGSLVLYKPEDRTKKLARLAR